MSCPQQNEYREMALYQTLSLQKWLLFLYIAVSLVFFKFLIIQS